MSGALAPGKHVTMVAGVSVFMFRVIESPITRALSAGFSVGASLSGENLSDVLISSSEIFSVRLTISLHLSHVKSSLLTEKAMLNVTGSASDNNRRRHDLLCLLTDPTHHSCDVSVSVDRNTEKEHHFCGVSLCSGLIYSVPGALGEHKLDEPVLFGPSVALEGSFVDFLCEIPGISASLTVLYELYLESNPGKIIGEYSALSGEIGIIPLLITTQHDGRLVCKASGYNNTNIKSSFSYGLDLKVIIPVEGVRITSHPSSDYMWEGQTLTLQCEKSKGTYVSYDWLQNGRPVKAPYNRTDGTLIIHRLSARNTGDYMCVASNQFNDTMTFNASDVTSVQVKEFVSKPEISFEVVKHGAGFKIIIMCRSEKGTPLKTFSLLSNTDVIALETTDRTSVFFHVPVELNRVMGHVRCNASNEGNWVLSEPVNLTVESVGGAVTVTPIIHTGRDFQVVGLVLRCKVERGTFPHYRWFLNNSRLEGRGGFYAVAWSDDSVLSLSVGRDSAGIYHCEASDRFDNSTSIRSPKMLISKEVLNRVSPLVVLVVLSCFALLNVAVMACCIYGVVLRRRYSRKHLKMEVTVKPEDEEEEDDLMSEGYEEDAIADRMSDSAQDEDGSVDETLLYEDSVSK